MQGQSPKSINAIFSFKIQEILVNTSKEEFAKKSI